MGKFEKILKGGAMGGLLGAATAGGVSIGDIARNGGFGVAGMLLAKKKKKPVVGDMKDSTSTEMETETETETEGMRRGGKVKKMAKGGKVKKMAKGGSMRGDGCCSKGKTRGRYI